MQTKLMSLQKSPQLPVTNFLKTKNQLQTVGKYHGKKHLYALQPGTKAVQSEDKAHFFHNVTQSTKPAYWKLSNGQAPRIKQLNCFFFNEYKFCCSFCEN